MLGRPGLPCSPEKTAAGTMMTATSFWTGSSQVMKQAAVQCIGVTVGLPARRNSSRLCRRGKSCERCSGTHWFQSQAADLNETWIQKWEPRYDKCLNFGSEYVEKSLSVNLCIKLGCFCKRPQGNVLLDALRT